MKPGTQVVYVPLHADGDITHPDAEFGFVMSERGDAHFVRYWWKGKPGVLRTVANSELTPTDMLTEYSIVSQGAVNVLIATLQEEKRRIT